MGLRNIMAPRNQVQNSQGLPAAGGFVYLYEPGTTTFIQAFRDSGLITPHTQPIRLSGSGRANIWISEDCDLRIEDRNNQLILSEDNANPAGLGASESGNLVANSSFEDDTNADGTPDSWDVVTSESGSNNGRDITESTEGGASYRFTGASNGGGSLRTTNFFPVNDADDLRVNFDIRSTAANVQNIVRVEWFDVSQVSISNTDVYDSTANPLTFTSQQLAATPPLNARFAKIRLIGLDPAGPNLTGSTFFDRIEAFYPATVSGIFDNIEIRNNEVISTNTNGEIDIKPNGTGPVNIISSNAVDLVDANNPTNIGQLVPAATNPHIAIDASQIQAKANATTAADLVVNPLGGEVRISAGAGGVLSPIFAIDGQALGSPSMSFRQAGTTRGYVQYNTAGDLAINTVGVAGQDITFSPQETEQLRVAVGGPVTVANGLTVTAGDAMLAAGDLDVSIGDLNLTLGDVNIVDGSLYLGEIAAGPNVANFGQLYVNVSNQLVYRSEIGGETNISGLVAGLPGGADTNLQFNDAGGFGGSANLAWDGLELAVSGTISVQPTDVVSFDGGGNTHITESSDGVLSFFTNGFSRFSCSTATFQTQVDQVQFGDQSSAVSVFLDASATTDSSISFRENFSTGARLFRDQSADEFFCENSGVRSWTANTRGELVLPAATTARSSLNVPHGAAPTTPVDGDMWTTTAGLFVRINGVTVGPLS